MATRRVKVFPSHFDAPITQSQAEELVADREVIARHAFFPFIERKQRWQKFAKKGTPHESKERPILYASRSDSFVFAHYRSLLYPQYEAKLALLGLKNSVLAYRRIPVANGKGGKCNIHFSYDAFQFIRSCGNCVALAFDVEKFFENLDHARLKIIWQSLLPPGITDGQYEKLPQDHFQVFRAVTRYSYINRETVFTELGIIGKKTAADGTVKIGYLIDRDNFPLRLCTPVEFREKLARHVEVNQSAFGVPQGSPISDLLELVSKIGSASA